MRYLMLVALVSWIFIGCAGFEAPRENSAAGAYFNEGNACFLAGKLPEAILAFERGLEVDPNDSQMRENLEYARSCVNYPFGDHGRPEDDSWPPWLYRLSALQVLIFALVLYALACMFVTRWIMTRRRLTLVRGVAIFALAAACAGYWVYLENEHVWRGEHPLVVVLQEKTPLRRGNGASYPFNPELPMLSRGMEARLLHERGGWLQIQFPGGEVGWVERKGVRSEE